MALKSRIYILMVNNWLISGCYVQILAAYKDLVIINPILDEIKAIKKSIEPSVLPENKS